MDGYEVLPDELRSHADRVDGFASRMGTAADAANTVTMNNEAYGVICQPFAALLQPFEELGVRALQAARDTITDTTRKVRDTAGSYETTDRAHAVAYRGIEGTL